MQLIFGVFILRQTCCRPQPIFGSVLVLSLSSAEFWKLKVSRAGSVHLAYRVTEGPWDSVALEPGTVDLERCCWAVGTEREQALL